MLLTSSDVKGAGLNKSDLNMEININCQEVANALAEIFRADLEFNKETKIWHFSGLFSRGPDSDVGLALDLSQERIDTLLEELKAKEEYEETTIIDRNTYEVMVRQESRRIPFFLPRRGLPFEVSDNENGINYRLDYATDIYFVFILHKLKDVASFRALSRGLPPSRIIREQLEREDTSTEDMLQFGRKLLGTRLLTLQIISSQQRKKTDFERYADAFFFQLSYNFDEAILPQRYLDDLLRLGGFRRLRRASVDEIDAPKRTYISDLIHHYQLAIASENPALEYLSYYHVIEHFFEKIYREAQIDDIREFITRPEFSYKRDNDIKRLITRITSNQKVDGDQIRYDELESLKLTLNRYIAPVDLVSKLNEYDDSLVEFYRNEKVSFSNGDKVNLTIEGDDQQILTLLSKRIYKTRNSLVHSKEGEKGKFIPFRHDKVLVREIPLMRFIAEIIIVNSSKVM